MSHTNARTTVHGRQLIVQRYQAGWKKAHIAAAMGISRKCVQTWIGRWTAEGAAGLADRSSRPHTSPRRTTAETEDRIVELHRRERRGPAWIGAEVGVPARTVSRVLTRRGLPRLATLDPMTGQVIRASKATAIRYERSRPGELVHMDVKKLARIPDGGGWRAHGRAAGSTSRNRASRVGFDYVHSLVDDHSRLAYSEILTDEKGATCAGFLARAAAYFADHGIGHIERVMTDNAWAYRWSLRPVIHALGARQKFIRPHCPWQNGKVERLNRTLATEWAYRQVFTSNAERAAALAPWLEHYNTHRRHSALGGFPRISRLAPT
ncbi:transposase [Geodermatophilus tzadiensis]|uniref:Transposase n=1 Tax=Geodermatophilus tzadiensis TaxID=1137988 RepID=A0A2T0T198_9ACTN|nr:IS481 family transposase [Geodermatophilus tzadiensis]PRY39417.1 transposase [Geodermatophilus tzadiensis]